jgi:hypothetical protein
MSEIAAQQILWFSAFIRRNYKLFLKNFPKPKGAVHPEPTAVKNLVSMANTVIIL